MKRILDITDSTAAKKALGCVKDDEFATKWLKKTCWLSRPRAIEEDMLMGGLHHQGPEIQDCSGYRGLVPRDLSFHLLGIDMQDPIS